jgi:hypothetical protein
MAKIKIESDDATAIMTLIDVLVGRRSGGNCFVDRHDRTALAPFYAVAVMNVEAAIQQQHQRPAPKVAKRSAAHPR